MKRLLVAVTLTGVFAWSASVLYVQGAPARFHHVDLNSTNPPKTQEFYQKVFGAVPVKFKNTSDALFTSRGFILTNKVAAAQGPRDNGDPAHLLGRGGRPE